MTITSPRSTTRRSPTTTAATSPRTRRASPFDVLDNDSAGAGQRDHPDADGHRGHPRCPRHGRSSSGHRPATRRRPNFNGADSFTYTVSDNGTTNGATDIQCDTATVTITVTAVNDAPVAAPTAATVAEDSGRRPGRVLNDDGTGPADETRHPDADDHAVTRDAWHRRHDVRAVSFTPAAELQRRRQLHLHGHRQRHDQRRRRLPDRHGDRRPSPITEVNNAPTIASLSLDDDEIDENGSSDGDARIR